MHARAKWQNILNLEHSMIDLSTKKFEFAYVKIINEAVEVVSDET